MKSAESKRIDTITGARFIAMILIVVSHFGFLKKYNYGEFYYKFLCNAQLGVDFFFMSSGFGMMLSYMRNKTASNNEILFAVSHVKRIYPIYIVTLLIGAPIYFFEDILKYNGTIFHAIWNTALKFCMSATLLQSATGMTRFNHTINEVTWFLSTLFCIYFVCPFLLRYICKKTKILKQSLLVFIFSIILSCAIGFLFKMVEQHTMFDDLYYGSPYRRVFYVISGMAIARIYFLGKREVTQVSEYVCVILSVIWFLARNTMFNKIGVLCVCIDMILCGIDLYVIAVCKGKVSKILSNQTMVDFGRMSMYIFLVHYLIIQYTEIVINYFGIYSEILGVLEVVFVIALTMIVSYKMYKRENIKYKK